MKQPTHQWQLQLLGQDRVQATDAGLQFLAHVPDLLSGHPFPGSLDGGVQQKRKLQPAFDALDGGVGDAQVLGLLGLADRDVVCVALDDGTVLSVRQGLGPGGAVRVDQEQNLGRGR